MWVWVWVEEGEEVGWGQYVDVHNFSVCRKILYMVRAVTIVILGTDRRNRTHRTIDENRIPPKFNLALASTPATTVATDQKES